MSAPKSNPMPPKTKAKAKGRVMLDAGSFIDALDRAIAFQRNQPMCGMDAIIALEEVRGAVRYAINDKHKPALGPAKR